MPLVGAEPMPGKATDRGIDINRATATELEDLPGVGPILAARIVAYRDLHGPFAVIEDLLDVGGIGEAKLAAMRDSIAAPDHPSANSRAMHRGQTSRRCWNPCCRPDCARSCQAVSSLPWQSCG